MTLLDWMLAAALVIGLPAEALWKTMARRARPKASFSTRLVRSLRLLLALVTLLVTIWLWHGRPFDWLGLETPVSATGQIGLAVPALLLLGMAAAVLLRKKPPEPAEAAAVADVLPQTPSEARLFAIFGVSAGIGWELLYRGFLLWALTPMIGIVGAVIVAAAAYALGHGSRDAKALVGSTIASFLFTIAYAATGSLWWLILLHAGLPLIGLLANRSVVIART